MEQQQKKLNKWNASVQEKKCVLNTKIMYEY